jgi:8-oxo-dGTP pyrophosphatase MutT (NUDIX family)
MDIIVREVGFSKGQPLQTYHAVGQQDYIAIVARTPDGRIPIVRQYRPALEAFTWELPAGLVDAGEQPAESCRRELLEETGYPVRMIQPLGSAAPCTGRLSNRIHSFFVETGDQIADFTPEPGIAVVTKTPAEIVTLINAAEFIQQLHLGALLLAELRGLIQLPR